MRGDNHLLAVTTTQDEVTKEVKPLFAFPIQVCKATDDKEPGFELAAPSGAKRKQAWIDEGTGELFDADKTLKGVRVGDTFHAIDEDAIAAIDDATKIKTMVALGTVDLTAVPFDRVLGTYFIQSPAKGGSPKSYKLVYEALRGDKKRAPRAIVTKRTPRSRQKLCVIYANESLGCLMMVELRFAGTHKKPDEAVLAPSLAQVEQAQVDMARKVLDGLGDGAHALAVEVDDAVALRQELIEKALQGEEIAAPTPVAETVATDNLSAMLEASLAAV